MAPLFIVKTLQSTLNESEMTCIELCTEGYYEAWDSHKLKELKSCKFRDELGHKLLFEDGQIRLWLVQLEPKERMGFTRINTDIKVMSHANGFAVSHIDNGKILLIQYKEGDVFRYTRLERGEEVWDLENIGTDPLQFVIIEEMHADMIKEI